MELIRKKFEEIKNFAQPQGITKRWVTSTLLVTAIVLLIILAVCVFAVASYYRSYASNTLFSYANDSVITFFSPYLDGTDEAFQEKSMEFVSNFTDKSKVEVMVVDKHGSVCVSSSGFEVEETMENMDDVTDAMKSKTGISSWTGFNSNSEHVMSVAMVFPTSDGNFKGAVRFVTSLKAIDNQIYAFVAIVILIYIIALSFVTFSGSFFVRTIVVPVRKINDVTKEFTQGNFDARIELQGDEKDEINELADSVNNMLNEVSATDKIKNDFISTVSHELRTPLTAIKGWGEMLRELGPDDIELTKRGTDIIISESERLSQLVEELLNFSRLQNGTLSLRLEKIDVLAELDETIFVFKERSKRDGIELTYSAPELPAPMMADPNRIKQVFVNVLDNAFKYTERGGMVSVEALIDGSNLIIQVLDTGCGIAQEDLPNVKMKFYKANIQVRGSGIGLAVVDELIKMHNGTLDIQSKLGIGTTVTIVLPIEEVVIDENIGLINDSIGEDLSDV